MTKKNSNSSSLIPIQKDEIVRIPNVVKITDNILREFNSRIKNHQFLLNDDWNIDFSNEWRERLEIHLIISKLGHEIILDNGPSRNNNINYQYFNLFNKKYKPLNKTDYSSLKYLKRLVLCSPSMKDISAIKFFTNLTELKYFNWDRSLLLSGVENIGLLHKLKWLEFWISGDSNYQNYNFLKSNINLKFLSLWADVADYSFLNHLTNLEELKINPEKLYEDHPVFKIRGLKKLSLGYCSEIENQEEFENLINLEELNAEYLSFKNINILKSNINLKFLFLGDKIIDYSFLNNLSNLEDLTISTKELYKDHPIFNLRGLKKLSLGNCGEIEYAENFKNLFTLKSLSLSADVVDYSFLNHLTNLEELKISPKKLCKDHPVFQLRVVKKLSLGNCSEIEYVENFENLFTLKSLSLWADVVDYSFLNHLTKLEELNIGPKKLCKDHPVFQLRSLKILRLEDCTEIENLEDFENLINLEELYVSNLNLKNIDFLKKISLKRLMVKKNSLFSTEEIKWLKENIYYLTLY